MLRIIQSTSLAAAKSYYAHGLSKEEYYSEGQELAGIWGGRAAERLGLFGQVEKTAFDALCENINPATGQRLTARTDARRTVGYDFNFNAPKSVSVLYGLTGDEGILSAFRLSVRETMQQLENDMQTRVRKGGTEDTRTTANLAYAEFVHFTARPVNGVSDPHLHAHCYTFNATYDDAENQWKAGHFQAIKRDAPYFEACFHARLAENLTALGYGIERHAKGWEIAGLSDAVLAKYSHRSQIVTAAAENKGITSAKGKDQLAAKTREGKHHTWTMEDLRGIWQARLTQDEWNGLHTAKEQPPTTPVITEQAAMDYAIAHSFERASVVREREVEAAALRYGVGSVSVDGVQQASARADLLRDTQNGQRLCTTKNVLAEEHAMIALVKNGRGQHRPLGDITHPCPPNLSTEQTSAVAFLSASRDFVTCIEGRAGVGKTTLMRAAVTAIEATGKNVFVFAPTAQASRGVLKAEGFAQANTVAHLLKSQDVQNAIRGQVVWIDEAGLMGATAMHQVLELAQRQNARVVVSGDTAQHSSVARGDSLRILKEQAGLKTTSLTQIHRQRGTYKQAVEAISRGDLEKGFAILDSLGAINELPAGERYATLARAYGDAMDKGKTVLAVSPTHRESAEVTAAIRHELRTRGHLAGNETSFLQLRALGWTEAERTNPRHYQPGMVVQFHQNARGIKRGERFAVESATDTSVTLTAANRRRVDLPLEHPARFQVYEAGQVALSIGDRLRITQNGYSLPDPGKGTGHRLNNGAVYPVDGFTKDGHIKLANGWIVGKDYGCLSHGFCATSHASQGATVDHVLIAESSHSFPAASRQQWYVSVSRGRESVRIFTDDRVALRDAVERSAARLSASELVRHPTAAPDTPNRMARLATLARAYASRTAELAKGWLSRYQPPWTKPAPPQRINQERTLAL